ncbi:hypothetical protein RAS1_43270 [Phycisphaerae bacterium RAS1]|nr:hypothetical protein RAS1_43270 [Phycisphaerae bacterium RAS1]
MNATMRSYRFLTLTAALCLAGCPTDSTVRRNPFLTLTENLGISIGDNENDNGGGTSTPGSGTFRRNLTLTLSNISDADLNVKLAAWVNIGSIRTKAQEDALIAGGYRELGADETVTFGNAFTLPPGTFVFAGPGPGGATTLVIAPGTTTGDEDNEVITPTTQDFVLIAPDVILFYAAPPASCDSAAFVFSIDGEVVDSDRVTPVGDIYQGATGSGGVKTLAQVSAYACDPFRPGLFLRVGGGGRQPNEYFEGESIRVDFSRTPFNRNTGESARVTIIPAQ